MKWVYRISDGQFLSGGGFEPHSLNPGEAVLVSDNAPDFRSQRYDMNSVSIRQATEQEITNYDTAQAILQQNQKFDDNKMLKAFIVWAAGRMGVPINTAKQEIIQIYNGL